MTDKSSLTRRGLFGSAGVASALNPFRAFGGVAWAAETPKTLKKWVITKQVTDRKITPAHFKLVEAPIPQLPPGKALVRIKLFNVHSDVRGRMSPGGSTKVGDTDLINFACAEVLQSRDKTLKEGDTIACMSGWQDYQLIGSDDGPRGGNAMSEELNGSISPYCYVFRPVMVKMHTPDVLMDVFGTSGMTAYFGVRECGPLMPGDKVCVAGTTGSVGAMAAQLVKAKGCRVVGFGGGPDRAKWVTDTLGMAVGLDYRAKDLDAQLKALFPDGIDFFSDGVGGPLGDSVAQLMKPYSRYLYYGQAATTYGEKLQTVAQNARLYGMNDTVFKIITDRNIKLESWSAQVFYHERIQAENDMSNLIIMGRLKSINTVIEGIDKVPQAIMAQYDTNPYGKLQVKVS